MSRSLAVFTALFCLTASPSQACMFVSPLMVYVLVGWPVHALPAVVSLVGGVAAGLVGRGWGGVRYGLTLSTWTAGVTALGYGYESLLGNYAWAETPEYVALAVAALAGHYVAWRVARQPRVKPVA